MSLLKRIAGLFVILFSLGCMGMIDGITNLDFEMATDQDAVHPTDFVVGPPSSGSKVMSIGMSAAATMLNLPNDIASSLPEDTRYRMDMIVYQDTDYETERDVAIASLEAAGYTLDPQDDPDVRLYTKDGEFFMVVAANETGENSYSLIRLRPLPAATP